MEFFTFPVTFANANWDAKLQAPKYVGLDTLKSGNISTKIATVTTPHISTDRVGSDSEGKVARFSI